MAPSPPPKGWLEVQKTKKLVFFLAVKVFQSPSFNLSTFFAQAVASGQRRRCRHHRRRRRRCRRRRRQVSGDICCMPIFLLLLGGEKKLTKYFVAQITFSISSEFFYMKSF